MKKPNPLRHGWFRVPGLQPLGDRSIEDQMLGVTEALSEARGKTVLDIGCAEGPISLAFAKAGAASVLGLEYVEEHLIVARALCHGTPGIRFKQANLKEWAEAHPEPEQFDIVLALGVIHKLHEPGIGAHFAAKSARDLILFRAPGNVWDGIIKSKNRPKNSCDWYAIMAEHGFLRERVIKGNHNEAVEYWRRKATGPALTARDLLPPGSARTNLVEYLKDHGVINPEAHFAEENKGKA